MGLVYVWPEIVVPQPNNNVSVLVGRLTLIFFADVRKKFVRRVRAGKSK